MRLFQLIFIALIIYLLLKLLKHFITKVQIKEHKQKNKESESLIDKADIEDADFEEIDKNEDTTA